MAKKKLKYFVSICFKNYCGEVVERERVASFVSLERAEDYAKIMNNRTIEDNIFYEIEVD